LSAITEVKVRSSEIVNNCIRAKVSTSLKPASLHAILGECDSGVPESQTMAGNSTVHIGTWESHIVPDRSFQQAEEARRKYGDMAVGPGHIRGVGGVMPVESWEPGTLEGPGSKTQRDEQRMPYAEMDNRTLAK
jgi:hypothetical protein